MITFRSGIMLLVGGLAIVIASVTAATSFATVDRVQRSDYGDVMALDINVSPSALTVMLNNAPVASGTTVPGGCYNVVVDSSYPDAENEDGLTSLTIAGPNGYVIDPNELILNETAKSLAGGEPETATTLNAGLFVFQPGSTYTIGTYTSPEGTSSPLASFTATGSGTLSFLSCDSTPTTGPTTAPSTTTSPPKAQKAIGTIDATVNATGTPVLVLGGHVVKTLKPGLYTIVVDVKAGLIIADGTKRHLNPSSLAFIGKGRHSVSFSADTWYIQSTSGWETTFVVS